MRTNGGVLSEECGRAADVVARFGGEEFALILPDTTVEGALDVVRRLLQRFDELQIAGAPSEPHADVSLSGGGVTLVPTADGDPSETLNDADRLLYDAKAAGRNRVFYRDLTRETGPGAPIVIQPEPRLQRTT